MANLQQLPDLSNAGDLPTYLNQAVMGQIGQANQFNQLGLQQNQADLEAKGLANMFSRQNNSQLLEKQGLENQIKGVEARTASALEPEAREAKRAELLQKASKADLDKLLSDAQIEMQSPDPQVAARGQRKMNASWEEITRRNKFSDEMTKTREEIQGRKDVANIGAAASRYGVDERARTTAAKGAKAASLLDSLNSGKIKSPADKASAYRTLLAYTDDPVEWARYDALMRDNERLAQTTMPSVASQGGKLDVANMPGVNIPTLPTPSAFPSQQQPQAPAPTANVPAGAVAKLRSNPGLAQAFDQKYGPGSAAKVLQGK